MSTVEKAVLTSVPTHPLPSVHEVRPKPDPVPHGKPWWFWWLAERLTDWLRGVVMARTTAAKSRQASHCMEREEHRTMIPTSSAEAHRSRGEDSRVGRLDRPFLSRPRSVSDIRGNATRPESFHPKGIQRLSIAIINHAVLDLLENGKHSSAAERWLLSREFDRIYNLLG